MIVIATKDELVLANKYKNEDEEILITGVGGLNVIESLQHLDRNTPIFNIGYVGTNSLEKGKIVYINKCSLYHPNVEYEENIYELNDGDTYCYTSNDFVLETKVEEPVVFDMELAYILALGFKNVISLKVVSDNLSYDEYEVSIME